MEQFDVSALKEKVDIVDYIKQFVDIKPDGKNYVGICPFHKEDTPSFVVSRDRQICRCFGCHKTLDIVGFAQEYHRVSFRDAVLRLYDFIGEEAKTSQIPEIVLKIKEFAPKKKKEMEDERFFLLPTCFDGLKFEPIKEWVEEGISESVLKNHKVGYDRVANSIAFPIYDVSGNIIALKHRTLDPDYKKKKRPKYIYSVPIGVLDTFYWYFQSMDSIREKNEMIIVEGEKSVMKLESWGITNVVASMTSDLSVEQIALLIKTADVRDIVIAFDKDKSFETVLKTFKPISFYKNVYVVLDYDGDDSLLGPKDAPCDKGKDVWLELYDARERIRKW